MTTKTRRVLVTLELETSLTVGQIRSSPEVGICSGRGGVWWHSRPSYLDRGTTGRLLQVQANAIRLAMAKGGKKP